MDTFYVILCGLAVWRLSYMLVKEEGPFNVFVRIRASSTSTTMQTVVGNDGKVMYVPAVVGKNLIGSILVCIYCCSVWISAPLGIYLAYRSGVYLDFFVYWLGLSGLAILIELSRRVLDKLGSK